MNSGSNMNNNEISLKQPGHIPFAGDASRLYWCEQLVFQLIWNDIDSMPSDIEVLRLAKQVFPSLAAFKESEIPGKEGMVPARVAAALLDVGDVQGATDYLNVAADVLPADFPLDEDGLIGISETLVYISAHFQKEIKTLAGLNAWEGSASQAILSDLFDVLERIDSVTQRKAYSPVISETVANHLYNANDLNLFQRVWNNPAYRARDNGALVAGFDDLWKPAKANNANLQAVLLDALCAVKEGDGKANSNRVILNYWAGLRHYVNALKDHGTVEQWTEAFGQATTFFNIDSVQNVKPLITSKQLFPMMAGMVNISLGAKAAGVPFTPKEYRLAVKPLEKISEITGRHWVQYMGDGLVPMKDALKQLFADISPNELSKRPLPKHLASILSEMLGNTKWIGQASKADRGRILDDELGL
jgi:hypothetical protein